MLQGPGAQALGMQRPRGAGEALREPEPCMHVRVCIRGNGSWKGLASELGLMGRHSRVNPSLPGWEGSRPWAGRSALGSPEPRPPQLCDLGGATAPATFLPYLILEMGPFVLGK